MTTPVSASSPARAITPTQTATEVLIAEQVEEPEGPDQRKRHGQEDDGGLGDRAGAHVDDEEDDQHGQRNDDDKALLGRLHVLELAAPDDAVALGQLDVLGNRLLGFCDVGADIDAAQVDVNPGGAPGILTLDAGRALVDLESWPVARSARACHP